MKAVMIEQMDEPTTTKIQSDINLNKIAPKKIYTTKRFGNLFGEILVVTQSLNAALKHWVTTKIFPGRFPNLLVV